ncbi:hypothetical protein BDW68DRAFT_177843 [Aspergillus falconensis]
MAAPTPNPSSIPILTPQHQPTPDPLNLAHFRKWHTILPSRCPAAFQLQLQHQPDLALILNPGQELKQHTVQISNHTNAISSQAKQNRAAQKQNAQMAKTMQKQFAAQQKAIASHSAMQQKAFDKHSTAQQKHFEKQNAALVAQYNKDRAAMGYEMEQIRHADAQRQYEYEQYMWYQAQAQAQAEQDRKDRDKAVAGVVAGAALGAAAGAAAGGCVGEGAQEDSSDPDPSDYEYECGNEGYQSQSPEYDNGNSGYGGNGIEAGMLEMRTAVAGVIVIAIVTAAMAAVGEMEMMMTTIAVAELCFCRLI